MFDSTISSEDVNLLELKAYEGEVVLVEDKNKLPDVFREISQYKSVGFDTETKPMFKRGEYNPVALLQIAIPAKVFLIRINKTGITDDILRFFESNDIKKIGVALRDDIKDLQKLMDFVPRGFLQLNELVKHIGIESNGLRKLTAILLGFRISKNAQVSNWEAPELTFKQITYAATDAWVCLKIFTKLQKVGLPDELIR
ncbi:MAG: 3'-5' exonuclease domain-containing protein 2 [Cyclobacteriaceae bacterium]|nr:3'-5' exonuclease domain-containing protein 2 [Cyclobacteriaceae bacterium]